MSQRTRLGHHAVGDAAIALREQVIYSNRSAVEWGDIDFLEAIDVESGHSEPAHPLNRHRRVLNALERDPRFEKYLFRCFVGNRETLVRAFRYRSPGSDDEQKSKW